MPDALTLVVILLATAVFAVVLFRRLHLPPILAYLGAGVLAGPGGLGWVDDTSGMQYLAEFGIVFLLFSLGLEFSIPRLLALRRVVFGAGPLQVLLTGLPVLLIMWLLDFPLAIALIAGGAFALSSTAIVIRDLIARGAVNTGYGRASTGILLFQDLAAVIMLVLLPVLAHPEIGDPFITAGTTLGKALLLFFGIYVIGKWVLPRALEETGRARSDEVFVMTALLLALLAAWVTHALGLSMALGAFLAGMMLGESHFRHQIEADIRPFRDLLLGLFFMGVGMLVSPQLFAKHWYWILLGAAALMVFKSVLIAALLTLLGERKETALRSGIMLAQGGEFGFVLVTLAVSHGLMNSEQAGILISIAVLTMAATPALLEHSRTLTRHLLRRWEQEPDTPAVDENTSGHVLLCGYGRVGQNLMRYLNRFHHQAVAIDTDLVRIQEASQAGERIIFGDATRKEILERAGIHRASLLVVTFDDARQAERILHTAHQLCPDLRILVRTRDDTHLDELLQAGAAEVVPEVLEASLMLVAHALMMLDTPFGKVLAMLRQSRRERYKLLHGYYHGESLPTSDSAGNPYRLLHAVTLDEQAACIGKTLGDLDLPARKVEVQTLRRQEQTIHHPAADQTLMAGDILILYGPLEAVEAIEEKLLGG
ncbi:Transporter, CPA2 family [Alloalcanivorax dieselolei B5]|uniref:Transporter, CPA2 family n=1 Tax=Alcanivorax dieselolei (strain DSM 16502 / CGMCC 1.3690 / MCCC 1A00001 / B-5) TaxID=930169 RepID=K0CD72_ALCDB|nr:monovalent cation:proton antiporter family protein [Alloalcanivorax dieselolei]AFT71549.1 Transporter, CPA2 family [Alloalcanivorax dieselolei B5]GGJ90017.1 potassium transporter Kef [Alloalcanivorax dieselolei]